MKKILLTLTFFLTITAITIAQSWTQKASAPMTGRRSAIGLSCNGKAYAGLGVNSSNVYVNDFWEYNPGTDVWTQKANYPGISWNGNTAFAINGKLYVGMGFSLSYGCQKDFWEYNPANNTWTQKADFPGTARYGACSFVIGDSAFLVGGSYNSGENYMYDTYMYNPSTNTWKQKANCGGSKRAFGTAFSIAGFGYCGMGLYNSTTVKKDFWKYNPITNTWSAIPDCPGDGMAGPISFVINNKAYVGLGSTPAQNIYYNHLGVYDPNSNSWQQITIPAQMPLRVGCIAFACGTVGYIGWGKSTTGVLSDLWAYNDIVGDLQGNLTYDNTAGTPLSGVIVQLKLGNTIIDTAITNAAGHYSFTSIPGGSYTLSCVSSTPWGGVNSSDGLRIFYHFVGLSSLTGLKLIAADVNNLAPVNASDALLCSKRFVNLVSSFASGEWAFENPVVVITDGPVQTINIKGLCYGDVNGSYSPPY